MFNLLDKLRKFLAWLWDKVIHGAVSVDDSSTKIIGTYEQIVADTLNLRDALRDLQRFQFDPMWKTRVTNVPRAIDGMNDLLFIVLHGFRDKFTLIHNAFAELVAAMEGKGPGQHFPDPGNAMGKVVAYVGDLDVAWKAFGRAYHQVTDLVTMLDDVKHRIETLDDLFLPQGSTKKTVDEHYRKRIRS